MNIKVLDTNLTVFICVFLLAILLAAPSADALDLGTDITIYDGSSSSTTGWYGQQEDQEVEPSCVGSQAWDLEGFFLNGTTLTMVGGYDFVNGETGNSILFKAGDIFIDTSGDSDYEYALSLNFFESQYTVYQLTSSSPMLTVYYPLNNGSYPWRYDCSEDDGVDNLGVGELTYIDYSSYSADPNNTLYGETHNAVAIDLCDLIALGANLDDFTVHFTMGCGNDNLMGSGTAPVPEPATIILMGTGLLGIAGFGRKKLKKSHTANG